MFDGLKKESLDNSRCFLYNAVPISTKPPIFIIGDLRMQYKQNTKMALIFAIISILSISISAAAESVGQKAMRLKREKSHGVQSEYARKEYIRPSKKQVDLRAPLSEHAGMESSPEKAGSTESTPAASNGSLLSLIDGDALVCISINGLDETLAMTNSYLSGAVQFPAETIVKTQIRELLGNEMLIGLDTTGSFGGYLKHLPEESDELGVILLPVTDYSEFVKSSRNISEPDENGISNITAGEFPGITIRKITENYGMIIMPIAGKPFPHTPSLVPARSIAAALDSEEAARSTSSPLWIYGNLETASSIFGGKVISQFSQMQQQQLTAAAADGAQVDPKEAEKQIKALQEGAGQLKSVSATLTPTAQALKLEISFAAKPGSEIAKALVADPDVKGGFKYAGYVSTPAVIAGLIKINKPLLKKLVDLSTDLTGSQLGPNAAEQRQNQIDSLELSGDEQAFYLDLAAQMPFIRIGSITQTTDGQAMQKVFNKQVEMNAEMSKSTPVNPFSSLVPKAQIIGDKFVITLGADAENELSKLAGLAASPAPTAAGDIKIALDTIENSDSAGFIASLNLIRLLDKAKALAPMIPMPQAKMAFDALADMNLTTKSCIAIAGRTSSGKANLQIALPKQHLQELFITGTMIQQ